MRTTNDQVIPVFLKTGREVENAGGTFRVQHSPTTLGWGNKRIADILATRAGLFNEGRKITAVIYSYDTPIAWLDGDVWVVPDAKYSATTSTKHATHLWRLPNRVWIPADCGAGDEYDAFISRRSQYTGSSVAAAR